MFDEILTDEMLDFISNSIEQYGRKPSPRKFEALRLYNRRYSRKEAAKIMVVSENTFSFYIRSIRKEFGITSGQQLLALEMVLHRENSG